MALGPWGGAFLSWVVIKAGLQPTWLSAAYNSWPTWGVGIRPDANVRGRSDIAGGREEQPQEKDPAAAALGRKGGKARAASMSAKKRKEIEGRQPINGGTRAPSSLRRFLHSYSSTASMI
jgi:hypothetical protein